MCVQKIKKFELRFTEKTTWSAAFVINYGEKKIGPLNFVRIGFIETTNNAYRSLVPGDHHNIAQKIPASYCLILSLAKLMTEML